MKKMKKVASLGLATLMALGSTYTAMALPNNTVVIGENAYSLDYFFEDTLIQEIVDDIANGGSIFFDLDGSGFMDAWDGDAMTDIEKASLANIPYLNADGSKVVYENFDSENPVDAVVKTALVAKIAQVEALVEADYTAGTWAALQAELATAKEINGNADVTQAEVDGAVSKLEAAVKALEENTTAAKLKITPDADAGTEVIVDPNGANEPVYITVDLENFGENVAANLKFDTTWGDIAETATTVDGKAIVKLTPEEDSEERTAIITVSVNYAQNTVTGKVIEDLTNVEAVTTKIKFIPKSINTGDGKVYRVNSGLTDQADRVYINLNQTLTAEAEAILVDPANVGIFKVYDNIEDYPVGSGNEQVIDVVSVQKKDADTLVLILNTADGEFPLTDNTRHQVSINGSYINDIYVEGSAQFLLEDSKDIKLMKVSSMQDDASLAYNQLKIIFSESVNSQAGHENSVTNLNNWVIDGLNLGTDRPAGTNAADVDVTVMSTKADTTERETVILTFNKKEDITEFLVKENHTLQVNTTGDWASITDQRNIVATQELPYKGIEVEETTMDWYEDGDSTYDTNGVDESPEQFVVNFNSPVTTKNKSFVDVANTFKIIIPVQTADKPYDESNEVRPGVSNVLTAANGDFTVTEITPGLKYLIEMNEDWTKFYDTQGTTDNYHINKLNPVKLQAEYLIDVLGETLKDSDATKHVVTAAHTIKLDEDKYSPETVDKHQLTKIKNKVESGVVGLDTIADLENTFSMPDIETGAVYIAMNEPVQWTDQDGVFTNPNLTPSQQQEAQNGVPLNTFEYVMQKDKDGNTVLQNITVEGKIKQLVKGAQGQESIRDYAAIVVPVEELADGEWNLVIRSISDDVGNTMKTEELPITISTYTQTVETKAALIAADAHRDVTGTFEDVDYPGATWLFKDGSISTGDALYAADAKLDNADAKDIVHVLFNQPMEMNGENGILAKANYRLDGIALPEGTSSISRGIKGHEGLETSAYGVTIVLPDGYLQDHNNEHVLTLKNVHTASGEVVNARIQLPYENTKLMHEDNATFGDYTGTATQQFEKALADFRNRGIDLPAGVSVGSGNTTFSIIDHIVDLNDDAGAFTINGNLTITTASKGTLDIGTVIGNTTITGNVTIDAPNATIVNNATIQGKVTIIDTDTNSFENYGTIKELIVKDTNGSHVENYGTIDKLSIANTVDKLVVDNFGTINETKNESKLDVEINDGEANNAPVLAAVGDKTAAVGANVVVNLSATDADGDALTYSITPSSTNYATATINNNVVTIKAVAEGTANFEVKVSDGRGGIDTETIKVTVNAGQVSEDPAHTVSILNSTVPGEKQVYVTMGTGVDGSLWKVFVKKGSSTIELTYNADKNRFQGSTLEADATAENVTFVAKEAVADPEHTVSILNSTVPGEKQVYVTMGTGVDGSLWKAFVKKGSEKVELTYNADKNRFQGSTLEADATAENVTFEQK